MNENIAARESFTDGLRQQWFVVRHDTVMEQRQRETTAAEAAEILWAQHYKGPGMPTLQDCQKACDDLREHFGDQAVTEIMQREGVTRLKDLWIGSYQGFVNFARACIEHNVEPGASWDCDGVTFTPRTMEDEL